MYVNYRWISIEWRQRLSCSLHTYSNVTEINNIFAAYILLIWFTAPYRGLMPKLTQQAPLPLHRSLHIQSLCMGMRGGGGGEGYVVFGLQFLWHDGPGLSVIKQVSTTSRELAPPPHLANNLATLARTCFNKLSVLEPFVQSSFSPDNFYKFWKKVEFNDPQESIPSSWKIVETDCS